MAHSLILQLTSEEPGFKRRNRMKNSLRVLTGSEHGNILMYVFELGRTILVYYITRLYTRIKPLIMLAVVYYR